MSGRIPLWIDLRGLGDEESRPLRVAATTVGCEKVLDRLPAEHEGRPIHLVAMKGEQDQRVAAELDGIVIVDAQDWRVIPLENLIAARRDRPGSLFSLARSPEEALLFRDTLEIGVHGVLLCTTVPKVILETDRLLRERGPRQDDSLQAAPEGAYLEEAVVTELSDAGPGDRVCIDTTSLFGPGEGLLVGSTARSFCLVHAETLESEYVAARPFRVNAGAVHAYVLLESGRTQYLSEVQAGARVQAVHADGSTRILTVGRAKVERRPHTLLRWRCDDGHEGHMVLQTAETIRLVTPEHEAISITDLEAGARILVHREQSARHFGMPVEEQLTER